MNVLDVAIEIIDVINSLNAEYMLTGSLATNLYGIPRNTNDADFVLSPQGPDVNVISTRLGAGYKLDPQFSFESITSTTRRVIAHIETGFFIEFFGLSADPHDRERFKRRLQITFLERAVFIPTVEDVIVTKIRWAGIARRGKDISDIKSVLAVQTPRKIDLNYIRRWTDLHGTTALLNQLLAETTRIE